MKLSKDDSMNKSPMPARPVGRPILHRTQGTRHGPITRLISPSGLGQVVKPFVFLDFFEGQGSAADGDSMHPHSGIATVTHLLQGDIRYVDTDGRRGVLPAKGMEWMKAAGGAWHGGGLGETGRARGFQLWIALPPELERDPAESIYLAPESIPLEGPVRVLLGSYEGASSRISPPSPLNYLAVHLKAGERWRYQPPAAHTVGWMAVGSGDVFAAEALRAGDLVVFNSSEAALDVEARSDAEFVLGSAVPHPYDLVLGSHSVHTSREALHAAQSRIADIETRLISEGRLQS